MSQRAIDQHKVLLAIRYAPMVLAPSHFVSVGGKVLAADMVMDADFSATDAAEKALGVIRACAIGAVALLMVDTLREVTGGAAHPRRERFIWTSSGVGERGPRQIIWLVSPLGRFGAINSAMRNRSSYKDVGMGKTITGIFATREEVELAVEHLVQEYGVERANIFIEPKSGENSAGTKASGGDAPSGHPASRPDADAALNGSLLVSVDMNEDEMEAVKKAFRDGGATEIAVR